MSQSERNAQSKNRGGKNSIDNQGLILREHNVSRVQLFPNRWSPSYPNLDKYMKTYIRCKQHKYSTLKHKTIMTTTDFINEPRREKTGLRGFRPGPTQTGLYKLRKELEA